MNLDNSIIMFVLIALGGIIGGYIAVALAMQTLISGKGVLQQALLPPIAAISVGMINGKSCLDLAYEEDSSADMDLNVVMDASGRFVEVQGTAESTPITRGELDALLNLASQGIEKIITIQRETLGSKGIVV